MAVQDRTGEFRAAVSSQLRISGAHRAPTSGQGSNSAPGSRSDFAVRSSAIAKEISDAYGMLQHLSQLAKRKPMFDDRPQEVMDLTFVIKQKLSSINEAIKGLQRSTKEDKGSAWSSNAGRGQVKDHSNNVVVMLQGKLTDVTTGFANVLETRTKNMQASATRGEQYISSSSSKAQTPDNPLYARTPSPSTFKSKAPPVSGASQSEAYAENPYSGAYTAQSNAAGNDIDGQLMLPQQEQSLTLLEEQQSSYMSTRSTAVDAIESTINELGNIFSQLSTMIAEQRETVQRIDANTDDIALNVTGAHRELLKYYARVSSNRWLMIKSMGVVLVFFLLWVIIS